MNFFIFSERNTQTKFLIRSSLLQSLIILSISNFDIPFLLLNSFFFFQLPLDILFNSPEICCVPTCADIGAATRQKILLCFLILQVYCPTYIHIIHIYIYIYMYYMYICWTINLKNEKTEEDFLPRCCTYICASRDTTYFWTIK